MKNNRTKNTTRNVFSGLINQTISIILPFINRTAILWTLGAEFTGLAGLFSSILNVLNIAELGFNTAIVHSLYKPMADRDKQQICRTVALFKKIYSVIGTVILIGGLIAMPFLPHLINGSYPETINIYALFFLYLINSAISYYLFAYKECLLIADQRQDIAKNIRTVVNIVRYLAQLAILLITKNFYAYLIVSIIGTIITNICIQISTKKRYPYYKDISCKLKMPKELKKQMGGLAINKICDTFRNSFDGLIISSMIGLTANAIYGNYYYIYNAIYGIMLVISSAMSASIGNSIVKNSQEHNYKHLLAFSQIYAGIIGFCTIVLACIYQPFMRLWAGEGLMLPTIDMILFCVYFYAINMNNIRNQYISGTGIWWKLKGSYIIEAAANLILNIVLGKFLGITGVIIATIITIILFNYIQRNGVLFKNYFKGQSLARFYKEQLYYVFATTVGLALSYLICTNIHMSGIPEIIIKFLVASVISVGTYCICIMFTKTFKDSKQTIKRMAKTIIKR